VAALAPPRRRGPTTTPSSTSCWGSTEVENLEFSLLARVLLLVLLSLTVERVRLLGQAREVKALLLLLLLLRERLLLHRKLRVHAAGREETHLLLRRTLVERVHSGGGCDVLLLLLKVRVEIGGDGGVLLVDVHVPGPPTHLLLGAESRVSRHGMARPLRDALALKPAEPPVGAAIPSPSRSRYAHRRGPRSRGGLLRRGVLGASFPVQQQFVGEVWIPLARIVESLVAPLPGAHPRGPPRVWIAPPPTPSMSMSSLSAPSSSTVCIRNPRVCDKLPGVNDDGDAAGGLPRPGGVDCWAPGMLKPTCCCAGLGGGGPIPPATLALWGMLCGPVKLAPGWKPWKPCGMPPAPGCCPPWPARCCICTPNPWGVPMTMPPPCSAGSCTAAAAAAAAAAFCIPAANPMWDICDVGGDWPKWSGCSAALFMA